MIQSSHARGELSIPEPAGDGHTNRGDSVDRIPGHRVYSSMDCHPNPSVTMKPIVLAALFAVCFPICPRSAPASEATATVHADRPGHRIPKTMYGIFFEDINSAADGGIYAELVANRGFDWPTTTLEAWEKDFRGGGAARLSRPAAWPLHPETATYLRVEVFHPGENAAGVGIRNRGFGGIALRQGIPYHLVFHARPHAGYQGGLTVLLEDSRGKELARHRVENSAWPPPPARLPEGEPATAPPGTWGRHEATLTPVGTDADARLVLLLDGEGTVDLDFISLFPSDTWKNRRNGLRADLVRMLADLRPGSLRFPGGCIVEGHDLDNMYDWKRTVGPVERRPVNRNLWGYWQSGGLGFFEYFLLAEDIGAEPLPILAAGMSCQFRKAEMIPLEGLDRVINDACDLVEFANGPVTTRWGKLRADMGHPEPFGLKMLGVGNENWGREFIDRYAIISRGIKARHPEIEIVSSSGAGPSGPEYDLAWREIPKIGADWIDEHYYVPAPWLFGANARYDKFDRKGPRVYVGEYACHLPSRENSLYAALAEASMMTGFERNSDIVGMTAYAPLFNKIGSSQWVPDLVWFTNTTSYATPSYHVQRMFMNHLPDIHLPVTANVPAAKTEAAGRIGLHTWNTSAEFRDIRVTRGDDTLFTWDPADGLGGWSKPAEGSWTVVEGALRQLDNGATKTNISIGDAGWKDYTLRLKARKLSGAEGFIIRVREGRQGHAHVNFGGWGNRSHGIERDGSNPVRQIDGSIETGRWYEIEISLRGETITAKLDGKTVFDALSIPAGGVEPVTFVAGRDEKAGQIIVKAVNPTPEPRPLALTFGGAKIDAQKARRITLTGDPEAINDLANPDRVAPIEDTLAIPGPAVTTTLPARSLVILRVDEGK